MERYGTVLFNGASGYQYAFTAHPRDTVFNAVGAVYLMTVRSAKESGGFKHSSVYVGQTGDLSKTPLNPDQADCFDRCGANCVCVYLEEGLHARLVIQDDLLRTYNPPCNQT